MTTAHRPMTPAEAWLDRAVRSEPRPGLWVALCALALGGLGLFAGPVTAILGLLFGAVIGLLLGTALDALVKVPLSLAYCTLRVVGWARSRNEGPRSK